MKTKAMMVIITLAAILLSTGCALYSNVHTVENHQETHVVSVLFLPVYVSSHPAAPPAAKK